MEEKNKTYIAADFARYHSGDMTADEMYAIEKAALEDPLLADALEGYVNTPDFESDIVELRVRLDAMKKKRNVFNLSSVAENKWWRIAALFIIIAGAGFFFSRLNFVKDEDSIVKNEVKTSEEKKENTVPIVNDSTTATNDVAFEKPETSKSSQKKKPGFPKSGERSETDNFVPGIKTQSAAVASSESKSKDTSIENNIAMNDEDKGYNQKPEKYYPLKGKVTDKEGAPVPYATVTESGTRNAATADANGYFLIQSPDSITLAEASATGFDSKKFILQKKP
ncbi:MAG: carboxypeptidase-like regulatory domain-containing protein, partial [Ginsengibacter sp.]